MLVILLAIIYPLIIKTTISYKIVSLVVLISGLPGVVNYYFQGKYKILLQAEGKTYIITNLTTIITILTSAGKIILLLLGFGVIAVQSLYLVLSLLQMTYIACYIRENYKWIDFHFLRTKRSKRIFYVYDAIWHGWNAPFQSRWQHNICPRTGIGS